MRDNVKTWGKIVAGKIVTGKLVAGELVIKKERKKEINKEINNQFKSHARVMCLSHRLKIYIQACLKAFIEILNYEL